MIVKLLKRCIPASAKRTLRSAQRSLRIRSRLAAGGYSASAVTGALAQKDALLRERTQACLELCLQLDSQPYFRPGVFLPLFPGLSREQALVAAVRNCLHGLELEERYLKDWSSVSESDDSAELSMARALNESILHGVRFCGGWSRAYAGRDYSENPAVEAMARALERCPGRALDIGAGGLPFYPVVKDRAEWVASDLALPSLRLMRHALGLDPAHLVCHDAQSLPFPDASFHVITSRYVIENILRPEHMLREVARVLCPGGKFLVIVPRTAFGAPGPRFFTNRRSFPSKERFEELIKAVGLERSAYDPSHSLYVLARPGTLRPEAWARGWRSPDSNDTRCELGPDRVRFSDGGEYPVIEGIPVLVPRRLLGAHFSGALRG